MLQRAQASAAKSGLASARILEARSAPPAVGASKQTALQIYGVSEGTSKIGGVGVTTYSPKEIPEKNRHKVAMEFEMDAEAIAVASLGQMRVIKVNYRGGGPSIPGNEDIVAVYRGLLKTYKPKSIAMFGASGGCTLAQTTILWLPSQKLPLPGAVGLGTCSGGSNQGDARYTMNGLDAGLSSAFSGQAPYHPGQHGANAEPAARHGARWRYPERLSACVSAFRHARHVSESNGTAAPQAAPCQRGSGSQRLRGHVALLLGGPSLPESREAMTALANFFNRHLQ